MFCSTTFDPEPKVGIRRIDLLKLYNRVVGEGGYDLVSDTKAKPLMWREFAEEFVGKNKYTAAQAFQVKNVYYKNLCAYEISTHWKKEPPPKEILEEMTAKGGDVMTRTLENYPPPTSKEQVPLETGDDSDNSPEQKTPKDERLDEDPGSGAGRSTRGLRHQPPQRVLFQPDLNPGRQSRGQASASYGSPAPSSAPFANGTMYAASLMNGASSTLASYEPSQSYPLSLKPVTTPANNPEFYKNERKRKLEASAGPLAKKYKNIMLPGTGFIGPNIYVRAQLALQSGIPEEEQYALHHLVKISHERGDKYRFDQFSGLAEALVRKALQVSSLFYDVDWDISYKDEYMMDHEETLNGLHGTSDVIQRLRSKIPLVTNDNMQDANFMSQVNRITDAGLIIRNMCMLDANAQYLSMQPMTRDYLAIVLDLPQHPHIVEMQHYALETAEQVLRYCDLGSHDALYHSLLSVLDRSDRGAITIALRTISRIAMSLPQPKRLDNISDEILQRVQDWLLVEDDELRNASLDFLSQYTSFAGNVENLLRAVNAEVLANQLSKLLFATAKEHKEQRPLTREDKDDTAAPVPRLSRNIVEGLLHLDQNERSSEWLRMCFVQDPASEMTQIALWQAYQSTFAAFHPAYPHLIAGDFIKNVSSTFSGATAQVSGSKYVIRGIRARKVPVEGALSSSRVQDKGKALLKCCWRVTIDVPDGRDPLSGLATTTHRIQDCAEWFRDADSMFSHILTRHLHLPIKKLPPTDGEDKMDVDSRNGLSSPAIASDLPNGTSNRSFASTVDYDQADKLVHKCKWTACKRVSTDFDSNGVSRTALFVRHVQTHLPETSLARIRHNITSDSLPPHANGETTYLTTLVDEKNDAAGVPLGAAIVLRNIAKFMPRNAHSDVSSAVEGIREVLGGSLPPGSADRGTENSKAANHENESTMLNIFNEEVRGMMFYVIAHNRTALKDYVGSVLTAVKAGAG